MRGLNRLSTKRKEGGKQSKSKQTRKQEDLLQLFQRCSWTAENNKCVMPLGKKLFTPLHKIQLL